MIFIDTALDAYAADEQDLQVCVSLVRGTLHHVQSRITY